MTWLRVRALGWTLGLGALLLGFGSGPTPAGAQDGAEEVPLLPGEKKPMALPSQDQLEQAASRLGELGKEIRLHEAEHFGGLLKRQGASSADVLSGVHLVAYAAHPPAALRLTRLTFESLPEIWAIDPGALLRHGERCRLLAMLLERRAKVEGDVALAAAFGRVVHAWASALANERIPLARLQAATEVIHAAPGAQQVSDTHWASFLRAFAVVAAADPAIATWVDAQAHHLKERGVGEIPLRLLGIARALGRAIRAADVEDKGAAAALTETLTPLAAQDALPEADTHLVGLYNHALTRALRLKLPLKLEYRTRRARTASGLLELALPIGCGWTEKPGDFDQDDGSWIRDRGWRECTTLQIRRFSMSINYVGGDGKVIGGDNMGGRLKDSFESDKASLRKVKRATAAVGRLSRGVPDSRGYEVRGEDDVGHACWYREWYYRSEVKRSVVNISLRREGIVLEPDPELEAILDSMTTVGGDSR